jgi:hypothetical protein
MDFLITHPVYMLAYFGTFGTIATILFVLLAKSWLAYHAMADQRRRSALRWSMVGYICLFTGAWFGCGIGGPPGNLLSADLATQNQTAALGAAILSMFFSVPGWACLLVSQRKLLQEATAR